jgi:integrase
MEANGRRWPRLETDQTAGASGATWIKEIVSEYWRWAKEHYHLRHAHTLRRALRLLRHNAATLLRREFGLEAAQLALGHASAQITDAVYAERDRAKVIEIMRKIG